MKTCDFCNREIDDAQQVWKQMSGWVSPYGAKGMTLAHPTGKVAHPECVAAARAGVNVAQETLV